MAFAATSCQSDEELTQKEPPTNGQVATTGKATALHCDVNWVQLWENGPKFAEFNVGATSVTEYGGLYCWGKTADKDPRIEPCTDATNNDTANKLWGCNWRMPTKDELQGLLDNCDAVWTTVGDVTGRKFTGRGDYSSNSIFLPAAGYRYSGRPFVHRNPDDQGQIGHYWSSTHNDSYHLAYSLEFFFGYQHVSYQNSTFFGSVRAVLAE